MGCCKHGNTDGSCLYCEEEFTAEVEAINSPAAKSFAELQGLLAEALEAMLNLAPTIRNDRGGCFGDRQHDCECTACKIRRALGPNAALSGPREAYSKSDAGPRSA